jgi:hypothetical protein
MQALICKGYKMLSMATGKSFIQNETKIYYDKGVVVIRLEFYAICLIVILYLLFATHGYTVCSIILVVLSGFIYMDCRIFINKSPQIVINNLGIETAKTPFYNWKEINDVKVIEVFRGKGYHYCLTYEYPGGYEKVKLDNLNVDQERVREILNIYKAEGEHH